MRRFFLPGMVSFFAYGACRTVHLTYFVARVEKKAVMLWKIKTACYRFVFAFSVCWLPYQLLQALRRTSRDCVSVTPRLWWWTWCGLFRWDHLFWLDVVVKKFKTRQLNITAMKKEAWVWMDPTCAAINFIYSLGSQDWLGSHFF